MKNFSLELIKSAYMFKDLESLQSFHTKFSGHFREPAPEPNLEQATITPHELRLLMEGNPVDVVKSIRARTGAGLKDAKCSMDHYFDVLKEYNMTPQQ